jgi:hypothetical protein
MSQRYFVADTVNEMGFCVETKRGLMDGIGAGLKREWRPI